MPKYDLHGDPMKVNSNSNNNNRVSYVAVLMHTFRLVLNQNSNRKNKIRLVSNRKWIHFQTTVSIVTKVRANFKIKLLLLPVNNIEMICTSEYVFRYLMRVSRWWFWYWPSCCFSIRTWRGKYYHFVFERTSRRTRNSTSCRERRSRMYFSDKCFAKLYVQMLIWFIFL